MDGSLASLAGFSVVMSVTPGPNNIMLAASGARHGLRRTMPHALGVAGGFTLMLFVVGVAVGEVASLLPLVAGVMRWVALAWVAVLAWQIATAAPPGEGPERPPMSALGAAAFQWVNPKGWLIALSGAAVFVAPYHGAEIGRAALVAGVFLAVALPCCLPWVLLGAGAGRLLRGRARLRAFNVTMAVLLLASVAPLALEP